MKSSIESVNEFQCRVSVEVTPDEVNKAFEEAYRKLQRQAKVQGFRPGKAPLNIIRKLYGASVKAEVGETLINAHLFNVLEEKAIRPVAAPVLEKLDSPACDQAFNFTALVDIMPTIEINNYKGLNVTAEKYEINDSTIEREIEVLRRRQARGTPVDAATVAAAGHLATIGHTATLEGNPVPSMHIESMDVILGHEELFRDLENAIIGMKAGESKNAKITLPADYGDPDLASKTLDFSIELKELKQLELPAFDDEFAKDLNFKDAETLKANIRSYLEERGNNLRRQKLEMAILDKLIENHPFEVPPAMVDEVIDGLIQDMRHLSKEERQRAMTDENLRKSFLATAKRRMQNTLLLWHINQQEKLEITDAEVRERATATLNSMGMTDLKHLTNILRNLEPRIRENMIIEKVVNFLIDNANITNIPASL
jgi:trigger factor